MIIPFRLEPNWWGRQKYFSVASLASVSIPLNNRITHLILFSGMPSPRSPMNGGLMNGGTPSPPSDSNSSSQQLPPACGARQLSKLKRFLTTLQQFGSDISPEIGERVRTLVLGLVVSLFFLFLIMVASKGAKPFH